MGNKELELIVKKLTFFRIEGNTNLANTCSWITIRKHSSCRGKEARQGQQTGTTAQNLLTSEHVLIRKERYVGKM